MGDAEQEKILLDKLNEFKEKLKGICNDTISHCYTDVLPFLLQDVQMNANYIAERAIQALITGRLDMMEGVSLPWASNDVALKIYDANKEKIDNAIIKAQADKIENLERQMKLYWENR